MGFNFPNAPTIGQLHPDPATVGVPQYQWNGSEWVTPAYNPLDYVRKSGDSMTGALLLHANATAALQAVPKQQLETYAAPFDAMAYSGIQVNGGMEVNQERGHNNATAINGGHGADQWVLFFTGTATVNLGTYVSSVISAFPRFPNYLGMNVSVAQASMAANDIYTIAQSIEGYRTARLAWGTANAQPVTISFWCRHANAGTHALAIRNNAATRSYVATYTQNVAQVDEYKTIIIPGCIDGVWETTNLAGMNLNFTAAGGSTFTPPSANAWHNGNYVVAPGQVNAVAGTSARLRITGVTVLSGTQGPTAAQSPYVMRTYDQELLTCRRYWQFIPNVTVWCPYGGPDQAFGGPISYEAMRANPTAALSNTTYGNAYNGSVVSPVISTANFYGVIVVTGSAYVITAITLNARM